MPGSFSFVGLSEADDADSVLGLAKHQDMQPVFKVPLRTSGQLGRRYIQAYAQRFGDFQDGGKAGVSFARKCLVQAFSAQSSGLRKGGHSSCSGNSSKGLGYESRIFSGFIKTDLQIKGNVALCAEMFCRVEFSQSCLGHLDSLKLFTLKPCQYPGFALPVLEARKPLIKDRSGQKRFHVHDCIKQDTSVSIGASDAGYQKPKKNPAHWIDAGAVFNLRNQR